MPPPRARFPIGVFRCHRCQSPAPSRPFHISALRAADDSQEPPKSRREAAREAYFQEIGKLPQGVIRRVDHSASQFGRTASPNSTGRPTSENNDQRTALPAAPARGAFRGRTGQRPRGAGRTDRNKDVESAGRMRTPRRARRDRDRGRDRGSEPTDDPEQELDNVIHRELNEIPTWEKLIDEHGDAFAMPEEAYNYAQIVDLLAAYKKVQTGRRSLQTYKASPQAFGGSLNAQKVRDVEALLDQQERQFDELIAQALRSVVKTDSKYLPHHVPQESPATATPEKGQIGGTPIGKAGMGHVVEDALRVLANRPTMEWDDPKTIAQNLLDGQFVKFRNALEKTSVTRLAEEMQWQPGQVYQSENVGFREPDDATKREIVGTIMRGTYADPNDEAIQGELLQKVARIAHYNGTYKAADKQILLRTAAQLVPAEKKARTA